MFWKEKDKQIFYSHTKKDKEFCNLFDTVCASVAIKRFRSELETIERPEWITIKKAINDSVALFFLIGKELVKNHEDKTSGWDYTQNWIAYEIGIACQQKIDVWVICDNILINFPIPYLNNYLLVDIRKKTGFEFMRKTLENYKNGYTYPYPYIYSSGYNAGFKCTQCGMLFNVHYTLAIGDEFRCPQCLRDGVVRRYQSIIFRKDKSNVWHWCKNCTKWPNRDYKEICIYGEIPQDGHLCDQCKKNDRTQKCQAHRDIAKEWIAGKTK